ncbi:MAG: PQQ-dependent sugar dehydrogenase [Gemmatimonadota bacterium]
MGRLALPRTGLASLVVVGVAAVALAGAGRMAPSGPACDADNAGLTLPEGFCALVVADGIGAARHLTVAPNGDVFVVLNRRRRGDPGGVLALRDTDGDGRADVRERFADVGGTGISLRDGFVYVAPDWGVLRYPRADGSLKPLGAADTIVSGLPGPGTSHAAKTAVIDAAGHLYVNIGAPTNSCQMQDRAPGSPGMDPCPQLADRAGIWRFDADRVGQTEADGLRFATGLRNTFALTLNPETDILFGVQHGRDQLAQNWGQLYTVEQQAEKPSEELVRIERGDDFGWPYCYHDPKAGKLLLSPEYGGDGVKRGRCAGKKEPEVAFPAHWAPMAIVFYTGEQFPARYRGGAFVAFHGSWNRAPLPQAGYNIAFVPFRNHEPTGTYEVFADGFAGARKDPRNAAHRPSGLAVGPDGSLYVSDDRGGRIWRILYRD